MKIAMCQYKIFWENKTGNLAKIRELINYSASFGVDLVCFPEMSLTGFSTDIKVTADCQDETLLIFKKMCLEYKIMAAFGWVKAVNDRGENHYTVLNKYGEIVSDYVKIHPFSYGDEDKFFIPGNKITVFGVGDIKLSTFICYDLRFPEIFQFVSNRVDIIIVAANWPAARTEHWECLLKARAIENQVYIVGVNCVGNIKGIDYSGDSCIITPSGEVIIKSHLKEEVIIYDIPNNVAEYRNAFPTKHDRRDELYHNLYCEW